MKRLLQILLFINLVIYAYGFYLQFVTNDDNFNKVVGTGVLFMVFILLPIFLWHRYKDKKIEDFQFKKRNKNL